MSAVSRCLFTVRSDVTPVHASYALVCAMPSLWLPKLAFGFCSLKHSCCATIYRNEAGTTTNSSRHSATKPMH